MDKKYRVGFIGCGNMGSALAAAISRADAVSDVILYDINSFLAEGIMIVTSGKGSVVNSASDVIKESDFVFLGVKPNIVESVLDEIAPALIENKDCVIVSMAAGINLFALTEGYAKALEKMGLLENSMKSGLNPIIRIMPNTPVTLGEGVVAFSTDANETIKTAFKTIMEKTGFILEVKEENIDAVTALSGCGPAFVYSFIEALAEAGEKCGLDANDSKMLAVKTVEGAAKMVELIAMTPAELRRRVCSPGGATIEGVKVLEENEFGKTVNNAVLASFEKTKILAKK